MSLRTYRWSSRIFPPLVAVMVVGGVWYAVTHRNDGLTVATASEQTPVLNSSQPSKAATPAAQTLSVPTVQKINGKVKLSVNTAKVTNVTKVEFYISNRLVGAAYSEPYTVSVDATILQPGTHQVVAKVYTDTTATDTPPADFTADAAPDVKSSTDAIAPSGPSNTASAPTDTAPPASTPPATVPISSPTDLTATAIAIDGPAVQLSWNAPADGSASSYQIWRDGVELTTTAGTAYVDNAVAADGNYNYQVVSISGSNTSDPSATASVTVPNSSSSGDQSPTDTKDSATAPTTPQ